MIMMKKANKKWMLSFEETEFEVIHKYIRQCESTQKVQKTNKSYERSNIHTQSY